MQQTNDGKVGGVSFFLKSDSANALFRSINKVCPHPGQKREVVGVKGIPSSSCPSRSFSDARFRAF